MEQKQGLRISFLPQFNYSECFVVACDMNRGTEKLCLDVGNCDITFFKQTELLYDKFEEHWKWTGIELTLQPFQAVAAV